mgnify:CR=1 FL=1
MPLVQNKEFADKRVVIGSLVVNFNSEGVCHIPDEKLAQSLVKIAGFSIIEEPKIEESKIEEAKTEEPKIENPVIEENINEELELSEFEERETKKETVYKRNKKNKGE